jgi:hypothetical protein
MPFSRFSWRSSAEHPADVVGKLHLLSSCHLLLREAKVAVLNAKRRGGSKKVWLQYALLNATGKVISTHVLCFKAITVKNFSNRDNIHQYSRNPFGAVRMENSSSAMAMVLSGGLSNGRPSNTVGVNLRGVALESHPRFVLSTGKGADGARTNLQWFGSDPSWRILLQRVSIEHSELKVSFEETEQGPLLEFVPDYRALYEARPGGATEDGHAAIAQPSDNVPVTPPKQAVPKERGEPMPTRKRSLSALPPAIAPPPVAAALRRRQRERDEEASLPALESPVAGAASQEDDMRDEGEYEYPAPVEQEMEESHKRQREEEPAAAAAAAVHYSGYDQGFQPSSVYEEDALSASSGSQPMLDVELNVAEPSPVELGLGDDDASDLSQPTSPASNARTPSSQTPFREGQEESAGSADFSANLPPVDETEEDAQLRAMQDTYSEAEAAHSKYEVQQQDSIAAMTLTYRREQPKQIPLYDAEAASLALPTGNGVRFEHVSSSSQLDLSTLPQHAFAVSPVLIPQSPPMRSLMDGLGMEISRSPLMFGQQEPTQSQLSYLQLAGVPMSPMSPFMLDW